MRSSLLAFVCFALGIACSDGSQRRTLTGGRGGFAGTGGSGGTGPGGLGAGGGWNWPAAPADAARDTRSPADGAWDAAVSPDTAEEPDTAISADTPSKLLAASVLQPRSTSRITKCTDTPSVTMCRSAMAMERNQNALRRNTSFNVNCGSKERCAGECVPKFAAAANS